MLLKRQIPQTGKAHSVRLSPIVPIDKGQRSGGKDSHSSAQMTLAHPLQQPKLTTV
jgi:hypothetical protein